MFETLNKYGGMRFVYSSLRKYILKFSYFLKSILLKTTYKCLPPKPNKESVF